MYEQVAYLGKGDTPKFNIDEIRIILEGMSPKKASGQDGLTADICMKAFLARPNLLQAIYNKCLDLTYFPTIWKAASIKVIPKPQREDYAVPKAYRPIGLLPVLAKCWRN